MKYLKTFEDKKYDMKPIHDLMDKNIKKLKTITSDFLKSVLNGYLEAALWTAELDTYDISDIDNDSIIESRKDVDLFVKKAKENDLLNDLEPESIGHDFWLTRNGHGAGFWDRDLGDVGDKLTELCKEFPGKDVYLGDNNEIIIE